MSSQGQPWGEVMVKLIKIESFRVTWLQMATNAGPVSCKKLVSTYMPLQSLVERLGLKLEK